EEVLMKNVGAKLMLLGTILLAMVVIAGDCRERRRERMAPASNPERKIHQESRMNAATKGDRSLKGLRSEWRATEPEDENHRIPIRTMTTEDEVANPANPWMMVGT